MSSFPLNVSPPAFLPAVIPAGNPQESDRRAAVLKHVARSERLVAVRPASQLEVRPRPEMLSTGIAELDALTGGIPRGCLTEICGPGSSGKTSVLLATISATTRREESCVLIDASDSFDPNAGAAAGLDFSKLLWVRCNDHKRRVRARTPVPPNSTIAQHSSPYSMHMEARASSPVLKLEQVLKATDLILQSGGFGLVALDLAGIPEKFARRIPLASWFRFQRAVEHTKTALLVISEFPCAQTCAALAMKLYGKPPAISHLPSAKPSHTQVLKEMQVEVEILRSRWERKPMQSAVAIFRTQAVRAG